MSTGTGGSFGSCAGFTQDVVLWSGAMSAFPAVSYATGLGTWTTSGAPGESRVYRSPGCCRPRPRTRCREARPRRPSSGRPRVSESAGDVGWRSGWAAWAVSTAAVAVLGTAAVLVATTVVPALAGWSADAVVSGSMQPVLQVGDVVLARPAAADELRPGDVLVVADPDHPGAHRCTGWSPGRRRSGPARGRQPGAGHLPGAPRGRGRGGRRPPAPGGLAPGVGQGGCGGPPGRPRRGGRRPAGPRRRAPRRGPPGAAAAGDPAGCRGRRVPARGGVDVRRRDGAGGLHRADHVLGPVGGHLVHLRRCGTGGRGHPLLGHAGTHDVPPPADRGEPGHGGRSGERPVQPGPDPGSARSGLRWR